MYRTNHFNSCNFPIRDLGNAQGAVRPEFYSLGSQSETLTFVNPRKNGTFWDFLLFLIDVMLYLCYNSTEWRFSK